MRGIAIIGIVLHNYCHWLGGITRENEYTFTMDNVNSLLRAVSHPDLSMPVHLLSFFGHYGVPIFFFVSAYGLVMKYEKGNPYANIVPSRHNVVWDFVRYHYLKLFAMMIVGFVAFTIVDAMSRGPYNYTVLGVVAQLGLFNNLLPHPDQVIWPGPYWFFGVMMQLYVVYRLLLYRKGWKLTVGVVVICWLVQAFCDPEGETLNYIRYNFVGGMLPFVAGLLYARYGKSLSRPNNATMMVMSAILVFVLSLNYQLWFFVPVFVCSCAIGFVKLITPVVESKPNAVFAMLSWAGALSAALFVCHSITRRVFIPVSYRGDTYTGLLLYVIASIVLALLFREIFKRIPKPKPTR